MKDLRTYFICFIACCFTLSFLPLIVFSADIPDPNTYIPTLTEIEKHKKFYDDPRPVLKTFGPGQVLPKGLYSKLCFDEAKMKGLWAEIVGFRAPDVVGKISPEIKPGKYTYKDLEKYPGFKELMIPDLYKRIKPGGPPFAGNIPEFEIIPTQQYYLSMPVAEATKRNFGKTKLDEKGYLILETWEGGYPFPQPSAKFKAQQVMYNVEKRDLSWDQNHFFHCRVGGYGKDLKRDYEGVTEIRHLKLAARVLMEPYGFYDKRAKDRGEYRAFIMNYPSPRDVAGTVYSGLQYLDPDKADSNMVYVPSLRRVRKLSSTDTQDPIFGIDIIYDDNEGFQQKISSTRYPYKFEILDEREYLCLAPSLDSSEYISSKGLELRNVKMERRPIYVVKLTQLDPNYVYSHRIFYIDKEVFLYYQIENFDRKGRLYRTTSPIVTFHPEMGVFSNSALGLFRDHVDLHSTLMVFYQIPAFWNRQDVSIEGFVKQK